MDPPLSLLVFLLVNTHLKGGLSLFQIGPKGDVGDPGDTLLGPKGDSGDVGTPGPVGQDGVTGDRGDRGDAGPPGVKGARGPPGGDGLPCPPTGHKGLPGLKGDPGAPGRPGTPGAQGNTGDPGLTGLQGDPGRKGETCNCGHHFQKAIAFSAETETLDDPAEVPVPVRLSRVFADAGDFFNVSGCRFIAPSSGDYLFAVVAISEGGRAVPVALIHNGQEVLHTDRTEAGVSLYPMGANRIALALSRDDYVDVRVRSRERGVVSRVTNALYSDTRASFLGYKIT